ncbi:hypothetical protein RJ640_023309 [Escallonia rubra]|uniref:Leucine-rich repeat-containing N-terminal plant-type domain-containing protein n=1 Tax=Escallonia rubra TaxID=112253 RepID=A0AA88UFW6_9ASTE|nr:hypothetical protein RJ640_023309 [Escallonia rubra]
MRLSMLLDLCLLFILHLQHQLAYSSPSHPSTANNHLCPSEQSQALLQFKLDFTIDSFASADCDYDEQYSQPKTMSWNMSTDCCTWDGVTCDRSTGYATGLDLSCSQLQGIIHSNSIVFQLSRLQRLNLAHNDFSLSGVPRQIGRFAGLTHLNLSYSNFSGLIPPEISRLPNLVSLDLSSNDQSFKLEPNSFKTLLQNLTRLSEVSLSFVNINSVLPMSLSSSLSSISLQNTGLHGILPDKVFQLPNLHTLDLSFNKDLTGILPKTNMSSPLRWLDLSATSLLGELPDSIGLLKSLNHLQLTGCNFSGSIPYSMGNLTLVTFLDLSDNRFSGNLPSSLSNLKQLTQLDLSFNHNLEGQIPDVFANLRQLTSLSLRGNNFFGPFPSSVANLTQLEVLDMSSNSLTGPLPSNILQLPNLTDLYLYNNLLNGTIPSWLFSLPSLVQLDLSRNQLTGPMHEFQYKSVEFIDFSNNELTGPIPLSIAELENLTSLYLLGNNLTGIVDLDMFSNLINLQYLGLSNNNLSVIATNKSNVQLPSLIWLRLSFCKLKEFPPMLRANENLDVLDLSYNEIQGEFPKWAESRWGDSLTYLNLSHNFISGLKHFPWKKLGILDVQSNLLQGPLPSSICNLSSLEILDLSNNSLGGVFPQCMGNFSNQLTVLNLQNNGLVGTIPTAFAKGNRLRNLNLRGNRLQGTLPRSMVNCRNLEVLDIGENHINDTFPHWLETLPELQVLVLRSNRFRGSVSSTSKIQFPFSKLRIIDLADNEFTGNLPTTYIRNFKAMMNVEEARTALKYMGEVNYHEYYDDTTVVMKGLEHKLPRILTIFTTIDLSNNKFKGGIPDIIGSLRSLKVLNLSHNSLVGQIPPLLGKLLVLESFDLSSNQLGGEIPEQLADITTLSALNLSRNHLVGRIPRGNQFNTFGADAYSGNSELCGPPLSRNCEDSETPKPPPPPEVQKINDLDFASGFTWKVVLLGYGCGTVLGLAVGSVMFFIGKPKWFIGIVEREQLQKVRRPITGVFERERQRKVRRREERSWKKKLEIFLRVMIFVVNFYLCAFEIQTMYINLNKQAAFPSAGFMWHKEAALSLRVSSLEVSLSWFYDIEDHVIHVWLQNKDSVPVAICVGPEE